MKHLLLHLFIVWLALVAAGNSILLAQYNIKHFTTKDGLSQGSVYYFLEDSRGYMWMSSQNGLNRLEGNHFRNYIHADDDPGSIGKGEVRGLVEAPNGDIWAGTEVCLSRFIRRTGRFQNYYQRDSRGHRQFTQNQPFFADDTTVWFLNSHRGVVRFNYRTGRQVVVLSDVSYGFTSINHEVVMDAPGRQIWLRLQKGVLRYDLVTGKRHYYLTSRPDDHIGQRRLIYAICPGTAGSVWLSTNKGVVHLSQRIFNEYPLGINTEDDIIYALAQRPDGLLWISTSRSGILGMDPTTGRITQQFRRSPFRTNSLADNHVSELYVDRRGWLWANPDPIGVDVLYPIALKPTLVEDDLLDSTDFNGHGVRGIAQDHAGYLWVGTVAQGVRRINLTTGRIQRYTLSEGLKQYGSRAIICSSDGQILVGGNGGISFWDSEKQRFTTLKIPSSTDPAKANAVRNVLELTPDLFLLATNAGLCTVNNRRQFRYWHDSTSAYSILYHDKINGLLFAGRRDRDLQCFAVQGGSIRHLYNTLSGYSPTCFYQQGNWLWIGTDNGLIKYHIRQRKIVSLFTTAHGLPDNSVFSLLPDADGDLWISTNHGLAIFDRRNRFTVLPETANTEFMSNAAYQTDADHLFLGTTTGLLLVQPNRIKQLALPTLRFVKLTIDNDPDAPPAQTIDETDNIRLTHNQNNISIQVAALDYLSTVPTRYQYRLLGQRDEWIQNGENPLIRYTNLSPGWYQLQVRALASNGLWTPPKNLTIQIMQPFWSQWWFQLLALLLLFYAGYWLTKLYIHRKQRAHRRLTSQLMAAQESERQRIAQDLHDDVGNTLAAAKGLLTHVDGHPETLALNKAHSLIEKAGQDLRTISHNLMPVEFDTYSLAYILDQSVERARAASGIQLEFLCIGSQQYIAPERSLIIYRIVNELLTNIQKHSAARTATVQLLYQQSSLIVTVDDDGRGMTAINTTGDGAGIGLKNIISRANYLGARMDVSSDSSGTCVILEIPYG